MRDLPAPDELHLVLDAFHSIFKSIDVRTVAVKPTDEESWQNLITTIVISEKTVEDVQKDQKKIPHISNREFAIFSLALPFEYSIFEQIKQGRITFKSSNENYYVKLRSFDPLTLKASSTGNYRDNFLSVRVSGNEAERRKLWDMVLKQEHEAKRKGYRDIWELFKNVLKVTFGYGELRDLEITIPSFAHIEQASFKGNLFEIRIKKPANLSGLQLNLALKKRDTHPADILWSELKEVKENEYIFQPYNLIPFDFMEVELIHEASALVVDSTTVVVPLENAAEPLLKALNDFCPLDELKRMLLEPQKCGEHPDEIFENAISWLLSIAGFNTIHLGIKVKTESGTQRQTDRLKLDNEYQIGAADIIAYKDSETLYLVDCDLKGNDTKKIHDLIEIQKHFQTVFKEYKALKIVSVLCSPQDLSGITQDGVVLFNNYRINQMFEDITRQQKREARGRLNWLF